jgi:hypothetical protein
MRARRPFRSTRRPGLIAGALAALALLVQALIPAAAIAHDAANGGLTLSICTGQGLKTITLGDGKSEPAGKHFMGLHCTACAFANFAAVDGPQADLLARPVHYTAQAIVFQPERTFAAAQARAPPRPPGQGPPISSID